MRTTAVLPQGITLALDWQHRFRALGWERGPAWRAALSGQMRYRYHESHVEYLPSFVRESARRIVDVGANGGQWSLALLTMLPSVIRLEAIEPQPGEAATLRNRLEAFPQVQSEVHAVAAGAEDGGTATLNVSATSTFSSLLPFAPDVKGEYRIYDMASDTVLTVPVRTLDALLADASREPIDVLKLDVQGFERQVIAGAAQTLRYTVCVLIETNYAHHYEGDATFPALWTLLEEHGFQFWSVTPPFYGRSGRALWADAVFTRTQE